LLSKSFSIEKHLWAGLCGLALCLASCSDNGNAPAPETPDEAQAIAEAEAMIEAGRPGSASNNTTPNETSEGALPKQSGDTDGVPAP